MEKTVSVAKARRILGSRAKSMDDTQVLELIHALQVLAREQVLYNGSKINESSNEPEPTAKAA